jgi:hypothetical protein
MIVRLRSRCVVCGVTHLVPLLLSPLSSIHTPYLSLSLFRDGLERVEVADGATVSGLQLTIRDSLGVPLEDMVLSQDPALVGLSSSGF